MWVWKEGNGKLNQLFLENTQVQAPTAGGTTNLLSLQHVLTSDLFFRLRTGMSFVTTWFATHSTCVPPLMVQIAFTYDTCWKTLSWLMATPTLRSGGG